MTVEAQLEFEPQLPSGETRFVRPAELPALVKQCERDSYLVVELPEFRPAIRGRLAWLFEEAVERSLELRGACPPGIGANAALEASLRDQLYRARLLGTKGLTLPLRTLEGITSRIGALDADDSATLRFWIECTKTYPVRLYLDVNDCLLGIYLEPVTLADTVHGDAQATKTSTAHPVVVEWVDAKSDVQAVAAYELPPKTETCLSIASDAESETCLPIASDAESETCLPIASDAESETCLPIASDAESETCLPIASDAESETCLPIASDVEPEVGDGRDREAIDTDPDLGLVPATTAADASSAITELPHETQVDAPSPVLAEPAASPVPLPVHRPLNPEAPHAWRHWMSKLDAARGPKPLNAIEQLFINAYVPLADARHRGIADKDSGAVLEQWASSFSRSYSDAFDAMRLRGRRPMMVLDIVEAAQRLARLHGARSVQLVLVDGMRFDLGLRVENHLVAALGQHATLTDRFLLWSALPTTTAQQLELIGRGPDALREGDLHADTPVLVARGRQASTLRRVRAGSRELLKLDLVEARLGEAGPPVAERLDDLAVEVTDALASSFTRMAPRTLVAVFGDHGFRLDDTDSGSSALHQGGSSPEEVLVPGYAWLVGQTH